MARWSHRRRRGRGLGALCVLVSGLRCVPSPEGAPSDAGEVLEEPEPSTAALDGPGPAIVDYGPCEWMQAEPGPGGALRCVLDHERPFRLWLGDPSVGPVEAVTVTAGGRRLPARVLDSEEDVGAGIEVTVPAWAQSVEVEPAEGEEPWVLPVRARTCAECHAGPRTSVDEAGRFLGEAFDRGLSDTWSAELRRLEERLVDEGWVEPAIGVHAAVAHLLSREHRFEDADALLRDLESLSRGAPRLDAVVTSTRGELSWRWGRSDDALQWLRSASLHAVRSGEADLGVAALPMYAESLAEQGYVDAALRWSRRGLELARQGDDACDLASVLRTYAWVHLLLRRQGWSNLDPEDALREALTLMGPDGECPRPGHVGGARLSLATLSLWKGEPARALELLEPEVAMTPGERVEALAVELAARLAQGDDATEIRRTLEDLRGAAELAGTQEARWALALGEGRVHEAAEEYEAALEAFGDAEARLDTMVRFAGLGVGRSTVGALHRQSAERSIDVLLALGRTAEASCVARQSEARRIQAASASPSMRPDRHRWLQRRMDALRVEQARLDEWVEALADAPADRRADAEARVAQQRRWVVRQTDEILREVGQHVGRPACEDLHQPEPGELLLGIHPHGDGWMVFAQDAVEVTARRVELRELDLVAAHVRLSELLLQPVADAVSRAERVRVHAVGLAQQIDVHLLPWEGEPLVAHRSVVYGVDVGSASSVEPLEGEAPRAVLVADPTGSLPEAEAEIRLAAEHLRGMGWAVDSVERRDARAHGVQERMVGAMLLHYAGHAEHDDLLDPRWWPPYPGGTPSWPASLRLAEGTRLAAPQILVRSGRVPSRVILSGCRTGALDAASTGMSLAVAFLVAGADEVLATSTVTADSDARRLVRAVYEQWAASEASPPSLADAYARARAAAFDAGESVGRYRVWVR